MGSSSENKLRRWLLAVVPAVLCVSTCSVAFGQDIVANYHSGNKLRVVYTNDGVIQPVADVPVAEWPIGTGHEYLNLAFPVVAIGGSAVSWSSDGAYANRPGTVAMSHVESSWPATWPSRPAEFDGQWNGRNGPGSLTADQESIIGLSSSSGLSMVARGWQWNHYQAQDALLLHYELSNESTAVVEDIWFGYAVSPDVGGDRTDDQLALDRPSQRMIVTDRDDAGVGSGVARSVGTWTPVGRLSVAVLETPTAAADGIDNDGDGLIDETQSDGLDNDGDWDPLVDDVGEDGIPETGDAGEEDGVPSAGEPNFDAMDIDEADQIGLTALSALAAGGLNPDNQQEIAGLVESGRFDDTAGSGDFVVWTGPFSLEVGAVQRFTVALYASENAEDESRNAAVLERILRASYRFPVAPPRPGLHAVAENRSVTLYWDNVAETSPGFEGYKIYRSLDPGFNDVFTVTDDRGVLIYGEPVATFDLDNEYSRLFPKHANGFRYFLGNNSGLRHAWTDDQVVNGRTYYYAVVAFNRGSAEANVFPTESTKSIVVRSDGTHVLDRNTATVRPTVESAGYFEPEYTSEHGAGHATGDLLVQVVDRTLVGNATYRVGFDEETVGAVTYSLEDVSDASNPSTVFANSSNFSSEEVLSEGDPLFDGIRVFLVDDEIEWDSVGTSWIAGDANWTIRMALNSNLGAATRVPADYEIRFAEAGADTAIFTTPIPVPFEVWNTVVNEKENILVLDENGDGNWNSGEPIYVVEGSTVQDFAPVYWMITLAEPRDPAITPEPPESGDVAEIQTFKSFAPGDIYTITTTAAGVDPTADSSELSRVAIVPNPYVINSSFEQQQLFTAGRLDRRMQFINLPQRCTIRIFDMRGRIVDTLVHDSVIDNGSEYWDLRSRFGDSEAVAYGIYVYHVEAPGIGEYVGRFAVVR